MSGPLPASEHTRRAKALELGARQGKTLADIARELNINPRTMTSWLRLRKKSMNRIKKQYRDNAPMLAKDDAQTDYQKVRGYHAKGYSATNIARITGIDPHYVRETVKHLPPVTRSEYQPRSA